MTSKEKYERLQTFLVNIGLIEKGQKIIKNKSVVVDKGGEKLIIIRVGG